MSKPVKLAIILAGVFVLAIVLWYRLRREQPQPAFADSETLFMHGSIGNEEKEGIPYWIWMGLPHIFSNYLPGPGGYQATGLAWKLGEELPVGFSSKIVGYPRVTKNCAVCHTATYRTSETAAPVFVPGGPAATFRIQRYLEFLKNSTADPQFSAKAILDEVKYAYSLPLVDRLLYRLLIVRSTGQILGKQTAVLDQSQKPQSEWGAGRANWLGWLNEAAGLKHGPAGVVDFPSIWNLKLREGHSLLWDGSGGSVHSIVVESAVALGTPEGKTSDLSRIEEWLRNLAPPRYPFTVDQVLAEHGRPIYDARCANCHEPGQERAGRVIPITEVATDRSRLDARTAENIEAVNKAMRAMGFARDNSVKTDGYVAPFLDGIWLRAPYLHNGSVSNLVELLKSEAERIPVFYRGYDVYDAVNVGFVSHGERAERFGDRFDASLPGNGNSGHRYGTDLSATDKTALLEYLKTK